MSKPTRKPIALEEFEAGPHKTLCPHCRIQVPTNKQGKRMPHVYHFEGGYTQCWGSEATRPIAAGEPRCHFCEQNAESISLPGGFPTCRDHSDARAK